MESSLLIPWWQGFFALTDPLQAKRTAQALLTFEEAARKVHRIHEPTWRNKKHAAQFISTLETYTFPRIGNLKVSEVGTADVLAVLQPIWLEKPETARRVRQRIGTVMKWAVANGWRQDKAHPNYRHGLRTKETQAMRRLVSQLYKEARASSVYSQN